MSYNKFYNRNTPPTASSPEGTYYVKNAEDATLMDVYVVSKGVVKKQDKSEGKIAQLAGDAEVTNVTYKVPLESGYYTADTARAAVPAATRKKGLIITYAISANNWVTEQFYKGEVSAWTTADNWGKIGIKEAPMDDKLYVRRNDQWVEVDWKPSPTGILLDYPRTVTYRNTSTMQIICTMLPENARRNVLFLGDNQAVTVMPDGGFVVNRPGISRIFVIPTENTSIYKTIEITVVEPGLRKIKSNALRLAGNGSLRFT
jgi:hypothetical protein